MLFSLTGFYFLYKKNKQIFWSISLYFIISFYIIASWTEWWYGAGFSIRPLISTYPVLAICLGYFLQSVNNSKRIIKYSAGILILFFIFLNQFQWWQYKNYILDPYRTNKAYYRATFLKTNVTSSDKALLMVYRDFTGKMEFTDPENYQESILVNNNFEAKSEKNIRTEKNNSFYTFSQDQEYFPIFESPYRNLTLKDHVWIKASFNIRFQKEFSDPLPCLVLTMERKEGSYGYYAPEIKTDSISRDWKKFEVSYLTPEIRNTEDHIKCYIWKRGKCIFDIDNLKIEVYQVK
jgi:hypothetical protein